MYPVTLKAESVRAQRLHRQGRWSEAETRYLRILHRNPGDADSLHYLGLLHADTGRLDTALQLVRAAIALKGPDPWLCRNLGVLFERRGDPSSALACYRQALASQSNDAELWSRTGAILAAMHAPEEAAQAWQHAVEHGSGSQLEECYRHEWANALALSGQRQAALRQYESVLSLNPRNADARFHLGVCLMQLDCGDQASKAFEQVLQQNPSHARAANNLGVLHHVAKRFDEAIGYYKRAVRADPGYWDSVYNLGTAWQESGRPRYAMCVLRKAVAQRPDHAGAWTQLGNAWLAHNQVERARACYHRSLAVQPGEPAALWNLGIVDLLTGDFLRGWQGYERRFDVSGAPPRRPLPIPLWKGEPLADKRLLLYAEQGLGDTIQFVRYARHFAKQGARILIECPQPLHRLLRQIDCVEEWYVPPTAQAANADYQLPLLSAPALVATTPANILSSEGYLSAADHSRQRWSEWLGTRGRNKRVGVVWAGNPNHKNDRNRSLPVHLLPGLAAARCVDWVSLQKGVAAPDSLPMRDAGPELDDFEATAGLIVNLDLVISVDTAVAHLAGALGHPVWILLPFAPDWRWMLDRTDSPWYRSARLFRQPSPGDWQTVIGQITEALNDSALR